MSTLIQPALITSTEQLLALGEDDGVERELIRGRLVEKTMTRRNRPHSAVMAKIAYVLNRWASEQPKPRGQVVCGEAGFRIRTDPDTTVGIDVAYISAELAETAPRNARLIDGVPLLAVEILSPSDQHEDITAKVQEYLDCGVGLVWVVDPVFCTVQVFRPEKQPEMFNVQQELIAAPPLPGLRLRVSEIFED